MSARHGIECRTHAAVLESAARRANVFDHLIPVVSLALAGYAPTAASAVRHRTCGTGSARRFSEGVRDTRTDRSMRSTQRVAKNEP